MEPKRYGAIGALRLALLAQGDTVGFLSTTALLSVRKSNAGN
jgi:hypothetical protein